MDKKSVIDTIDLVFERLNNLEDLSDLEKTSNLTKEDISILYKCDFGMENWDWPQGVGLYGLAKFDKEQKSQKFEEYLNGWYNKKDFSKLIKNINTCSPMLTLTRIDKTGEYKDNIYEWAEYLINDLPKTGENMFQHLTTNFTSDGVNLNEDQVWIDTIFMAVLFLNEVGFKFNEEKYKEEAAYQVLQHIKYLYNKDNGLFFHGWNFKLQSNYGKVHWCRGNSWFTCGMVDYLEQIKDIEAYRPIYRYILNVLNNQIDSLMKLQDSNTGLWHTVLTNNDTYIETSGSAAILAGVLKAIRIGLIDDKYLEKCLYGIEGLKKYVDENGAVRNVSVGTGIGDDEEFYNNIKCAPMAYGQSLVIIALSEYLNHI